jgi:hypothetical protein
MPIRVHSHVMIHVVLRKLNCGGCVAICDNNMQASDAGWRGGDPKYESVPSFDARERSAHGLFASSVSITGYMMIAAMALALPFALKYPRSMMCLQKTNLGRTLNNFNIFFATHLVMFAASLTRNASANPKISPCAFPPLNTCYLFAGLLCLSVVAPYSNYIHKRARRISHCMGK